MTHIHVTSQRRFTKESLLTYHALVRLLIRMKPHMNRQRATLRESLIAHRAHERFLFRVRAIVHF